MTLKLFVADDSETIQKVIRLAFEDTDTIIESVTDSEDVLESIRAFSPDVVLADVCMPGISGYEICSLIKNNRDLSRIPVVLLVGTFEKFDENEAARVHYDARLTKPFDPSELVNVVQKLVGRTAMGPEIESEPNASFREMETHSNTSTPFANIQKTGIPVSGESLESFLGDYRILDLFDAESVQNAKNLSDSGAKADASTEDATKVQSLNTTITADQISEELMNTIVERVVKRMSEDVINEIAWEVVPELSEIIIRRTLEENK